MARPLAARTVPELDYRAALELKILLHRHVLDAYLDGRHLFSAPVHDYREGRFGVFVEDSRARFGEVDGRELHALAGAMDEAHRPQFHYTCRAGWLCDVNGPIFHAGEYHLFYEYNPAGPTWTYANMHWGHAVSTDLLRWRELPPILAPDRHGPVNSGSVAVDWNDTCGLAAGGEPVLVALYTEGRYLLPGNRPAAQSLAYSNDRGRTWTRFAGNPVLGRTTHYARDPKVLWHAASGRWIMALILSEHGDERDHRFGLFSSPDLRQWRRGEHA